MFRILSGLIALPFLLLGVAVAGLYVAYGQVDPCRALAVEEARRTEADTGIHLGGVVEPWMRIQTSQLSTGRCARELVRSWKDRWNSDERSERSGRDYGDYGDYRRDGDAQRVNDSDRRRDGNNADGRQDGDNANGRRDGDNANGRQDGNDRGYDGDGYEDDSGYRPDGD